MKKVLALMFAITMLFAACSKEKKLNKKLDGSWSVHSIHGEKIGTDGGSIIFTFNKDEEEGSYEIVTLEIINGVSYTNKVKGTYTLTEDEMINLIPTTASENNESFTVISYSKKDLTLKSSNLSRLLYYLEKI